MASNTAPGADRQSVTTKNRKPVANALSESTPRLPRKLTNNYSRTAIPFTEIGSSRTRKSSGPIT